MSRSKKKNELVYFRVELGADSKGMNCLCEADLDDKHFEVLLLDPHGTGEPLC